MSTKAIPLLLDLAQIVLFALHLIAVDVAAVGPLVCIVLAYRAGRRGDRAADLLGRRLATWCLLSLVIGIGLGLLGGVLIWFNKPEPFFTGLREIPTRRLWFGVAELAFYFVCMLPYRLWWHRAGRHPFWHAMLALVAATNLIYHFPPLFSVVTVLSTRPDMWGGERHFISLMLEPEAIARIVHHLLAAVVVAGAATMWLAGRLRREGVAEEDVGRLTCWPARMALAAALAQVLVGLWVLASMAPVSRNQILGGGLTATLSFGLGVVGAIVLLHVFAAASSVDAEPKETTRAVALVVAVMLLMTATRHLSRRPIYERIERQPVSAAAMFAAAISSPLDRAARFDAAGPRTTRRTA